MNSPSHDKPLLVYDGDCSFCKIWIEYWKLLTGERVSYAPFQEVADVFPNIPQEDFKKSVQLITPDGNVVSGAQAVFKTLGLANRLRWLTWLHTHVPGVSSVSEWSYRFIARRRDAFYRLTVMLWGRRIQVESHGLTRSVFLRGMGLIYCVAFLSLSVQVLGLVGSRGILPASQFLAAVQEQIGDGAWVLFPTLAWFSASDAFLQFLCIGGVGLSILFIIGIFPRPIALLLWVFYLSLYMIGQDFLSFQWDILLLEAGFLTIFFAPLRSLSHLVPEGAQSTKILFLIRLLLFRLMFQSGVVKLTSGDASWFNLSALTFHYETQCIPTPIAWYAHQLPLWFHEASVLVMFFIEIIVPFLIFMPRRLRIFGAWSLIAFQVLIILTGNYTFFNYLTIVLCLTLFDDAAIRRVLPERIAQRLAQGEDRPVGSQFTRVALISFVSLMVVLNIIHLGGLFVEPAAMPGLVTSAFRWSSRYSIVNSYGLFRVMTTSRPEIIVEGSNDGRQWLAYDFKYKVGDTLRAPPWVAPHQPRLDWQMWFAALGNYRSNRWFVNFMVRLLEGSPEVLARLEQNPFPDSSPRYVRALLYEYHFTDAERHHATGAYWRREYKGIYLPAISLRRN